MYKEKEHAEIEFTVSYSIVLRISIARFMWISKNYHLENFLWQQILILQVGPIPINDGIGKEIVTKITTGMETNKKFYTDSNGRDFIERVWRILVSFVVQKYPL